MRFRNTRLAFSFYTTALAFGLFPSMPLQGAPAPPSAGEAAPVSPLKGKLADRIVAWVDETALTLSELEEALVHYRSQGLLPPGPTDEVRLREALERWIDDALLFAAAEKMRIEISTENLDNRVENILRQAEKNHGGAEALDRFLAATGQDRAVLREQLRRWTRREWMIAQAVNSRVAVSDADVARFIEERKKEGLPVVRYRLSHLFIPVSRQAPAERWAEAEARARQIIQTIGNQVFVEAAQDYAAGRRAEGIEGGFLGILTPEDMKPPLAAAVENLGNGEHSDPVRSETGVHVLYLEHKTTPREMLHARRFEEEYEKWALRLRETASIQIMLPILKDL